MVYSHRGRGATYDTVRMIFSLVKVEEYRGGTNKKWGERDVVSDDKRRVLD